MQVSCQHISANCNPMPNSIKFYNKNQLVFCFKNQVAVYNLNINQILYNINSIISSLNVDKIIAANRANCINVLNTQTNQDNYLLVGYDSGHLLLYKFSNNYFKCIQSIEQKASLISIHQNQSHIFSNNNLGEIHHYYFNKEQLQLSSNLTFPLNKIIQTITSTIINDNIVIFMAGVDHKIYCYGQKDCKKDQKLQYYFSLSGHENSINKLILSKQNNDYLLASASKDGYIRVWRITSDIQKAKFHKNVHDLLTFYRVFLDSVLISHQCSVTSLCWAYFNSLKLVSCSLDCTICIWGCNEDGTWSVDNRMGQLIGNKNAYFEVLTSPCYSYLLTVNYVGAVIIWSYDKLSGKFTLRQSFNGHFDQVKSLQWNHTGDFLVSAGKDQTTRVLARNKQLQQFHEISRAQVHGYDINSITVLKVKQNTIDVIVCGADEKVIRILQPPACFANYLNSFTGANLHLYFDDAKQQVKFIQQAPEEGKILLYQSYAEGGSQVLGLMTKVQRVQRQKIISYYEEQDEELDQQTQNNKTNYNSKQHNKINYNQPANEDYLNKHTLWPQINKLYGHPHEISCITHSYNGQYLASACYGLNQNVCSIIIWNTKIWKIYKIIKYHTYTVFDMQFSKSGKYFASVSKDRKLAIFDNNFQQIYNYQAHNRTINSVSFNKIGNLLITSSKDKSIKIHHVKDQKILSQYKIKQIPTTAKFCHSFEDIIGCGFDNGNIILYRLSVTFELIPIWQVDNMYGHSECINVLRWNNDLFATCSNDHSVKIFKIQVI